MRRLRAGIIGLGVGEAHVPGLKNRGVELRAICDLNPEKLRDVAGRLKPAGYTTEDPERILSDPEIDLVSIASYDQDHCRQALAAIAAGKHVFIEKPLCLTKAEAMQIRAALQANPAVKMSSNLILRYSQRFAAVRKLIADGKFGTMYNLEADYNYGRIEKLLSGWRGALPTYSVTLGGGIHVLDLLMWLSGQSVTEVVALGAQIATAGTQVQFPDTVSALLKFSGGAIGKLGCNFPCVYPHFHKISVYGTAATFENDLSGGRLILSRKSPDPILMQEPYKPEGKHQALEAFVAHLQGDSHGGTIGELVTVEDIFRVMAVCFAVDESVRTGKTVRVQPL